MKGSWLLPPLHIGCFVFINPLDTAKFYRPICTIQSTLQWRHYDRGGVSNHQPHDCLFSRLFRHRWNKTSKHRVPGLCEGNSPVTGEFPAQRANNTENVSISWRHHEQELYGIYDRQINLSTLSDNTVRAYVLECYVLVHLYAERK